jgi:hypothetical protein
MPTPKIQVDSGAAIDGPEVIKFVGGDGVTLTQTADDEKAVVTIAADIGDIGTPDASEVAVEDAGEYFGEIDVEAVLQEIGAEALSNLRVSYATFTETAAAGVYTADLSDIPDGAFVFASAWQTTAAWDADTTVLDVGDADPDVLIDGVDVDGADEVFNWVAATAYPHVVDTAVTAVITTTGAGGTTGRSTVIVLWAAPVAVAATKVAS